MVKSKELLHSMISTRIAECIDEYFTTAPEPDASDQLRKADRCIFNILQVQSEGLIELSIGSNHE